MRAAEGSARRGAGRGLPRNAQSRHAAKTSAAVGGVWAWGTTAEPLASLGRYARAETTSCGPLGEEVGALRVAPSLALLHTHRETEVVQEVGL